jgi:hypothetical protein
MHPIRQAGGGDRFLKVRQRRLEHVVVVVVDGNGFLAGIV